MRNTNLSLLGSVEKGGNNVISIFVSKQHSHKQFSMLSRWKKTDEFLTAISSHKIRK